MSLADFIRRLVVQTPWGLSTDGLTAPPPPARDGRTAALTVLADFIAELTFYRAGEIGKQPIGFQIPRRRIFVEFPESEQEYKELPAMAIIASGEAEYNALGLGGGSDMDESSYNKYGLHTALQSQSDYRETVFIDILCKTKQERAAVREGLVHALGPAEAMYGFRLRMPDYYDQVATYSLTSSSTIDDDGAMKNRRSLRLTVEVSFIQVLLLPAPRLVPQFKVLVDYDPDDPTAEFDVESAEIDVVGEEASEDLPTIPFVDRP